MKRSLENMNIAIVHEWITNVAGAERVLLVLHEMFPDAPIFTAVFDPAKAKPFASLDVRPSCLQNIPMMKAKREFLIPFTPFAFEQFALSGFDLVISSSTFAAKGIITKPSTIHVSYCHTPPRYLWEPELDPRAKKGRLAWLRNNTTHKLRLWDRVAADRVDHFIANSHYVAKRIKKYYQRDAAVVHPSIDPSAFHLAPEEDIKDYFLFVSRLVNYKKCDLVVAAFNELGWPLKVIGCGPEKENLQKLAKPNIEFLGYLSDEEMSKYYSEAKAFVFAAEEDFGIVPLEAMASGRPVIAFGKGGLTESIIEGKTGTFFPEQTVESLVSALKNFKAENYNQLEIRKHAENFSTANFKKEFMDVINKILM
ncbi:MAG: glycosyltransferase [bacterium]